MSKAFIRSRWFEDIPVGEFHVFGSHTFSELEIIEFGHAYAPQPHHTQPQTADGGGLVAAPWHVTAMWMRMMVNYMERYAAGVQDGRPVRPGHTVTFTYEIIAKSEKIVRDRWGIIRSRNEAFNQYNDRVMAFEIDILAERSPDQAGA